MNVSAAAGVAEIRCPQLRSYRAKALRAESGAALLVFLLLLISAASYTLLTKLNAAATTAYRDKQTARALAEAKAGLIGFAAGANIAPISPCVANCPRPGDLPCPDKNNDGNADNPCSNNLSTCPGLTCRLGRLPWKTLGLPDLRDGAGERLWYAVSNDFKDSPRRPCGSSGGPGCLNSDSRGTLTLRNRYNTKLHDGSVTDPYVKSGAVALVIAPGSVLRRQQSSTSFYNQHRECLGCVTDVCPSNPPANTPACRAINYLDRRVGWENNENFVDGGTDGFIQGDIRDSSGNMVVNDKILPISYQDIMPMLERRVAGEILTCLEAYAHDPSNPANNGRYPWAALLHDPPVPLPPPSPPPNYDDDTGVRFGRLPDVLLDDTGSPANAAMSNNWPTFPTTACKLPPSPVSPSWWTNWKERVFYALADAYKPDANTNRPNMPSCGGAAACLNVNGPSVMPDRQVVVIVAGKRLKDLPGAPANQIRGSPTEKADARHYLEQGFGAPPILVPPAETIVTGPPAATFNDVVVYLPR